MHNFLHNNSTYKNDRIACNIFNRLLDMIYARMSEKMNNVWWFEEKAFFYKRLKDIFMDYCQYTFAKMFVPVTCVN